MMNQPTPPFPAKELSPGAETGLPLTGNFPDEDSGLLSGFDQEFSSHPAADINTNTNAMRKLIICRDGEIVREYVVGRHDISIGRKNSNDIQLNDLALSGKHAVITSSSGYVQIEDLGSTNGTTVNGKHIKKVTLAHGDIIQLGNHQITYLCDTQARFEPTMFFNAEQDKTQIIFSETGRDSTITGGMPLAGLREKGSTRAKAAVELRKASNSIGFQGKCLARITRNEDHYSISAVTGPQNRRASDIPKLNGLPLDDKEHFLYPNDIIEVAGFELEFYFLD
jgi:hypothetical protein